MKWRPAITWRSHVSVSTTLRQPWPIVVPARSVHFVGMRFRIAAFISVAATLAACEPANPPTEAWPGASWAPTTAAEAGFDSAALDAVTAAAASNSRCLGVYHDGKVVTEQYWNDMTATSPKLAFSITKSLSATLIGIAENAGLLSTSDLMTTYEPSWIGTASDTITVEDLLQMDSGRTVVGGDDTFGLSTAQDQTAFAAARGQSAPPNTVWEYNNSGVQMLEPVIRQATGLDADAYARQVLFTPLGMSKSSIAKDATGHPRLYTGLLTTCGDLGRFGLMWMRNGRWGNQQIVPQSWVTRSVAPTPLKAGYGYLWWLNPANNFPGGTPDTFVGVGFGGNYVFVIPSLKLVITRMIPGGLHSDTFGDQMPGNVLAARAPATSSTSSAAPTTTSPGPTSTTPSVSTTSASTTTSTP